MPAAEPNTPDLQSKLEQYELDPNVKYLYGTAGFRMRADMMQSVAFRVGMIAAVLGGSVWPGKVLGVMLTASHNHVDDNGVKLVAPTGETFPSHWEPLCEAVANCPLAEITDCFGRFGVSLEKKPIGTIIAIGRDTRPSGKLLFEAMRRGAEWAEAEVIDLGLVTTPECHWYVSRLNEGIPADRLEFLYLHELADAYKAIVAKPKSAPRITIDCSNGVGALKMRKLADLLHGYLELTLINDEGGVLNEGCGADFVKTNHCPPVGLSKEECIPAWHKFASIDGDADRLVYFTFDGSGRFVLLDGDRISCLLAMVLKKTIIPEGDTKLSMGVVQTAYANGGSTEFIQKQLGIPIVCTSTGVKYLHEAAQRRFDVGIYFEANGHGTVLFKPEALRSPQLKMLSRLANQLVGDALSDLLFVEALLSISGVGVHEWCQLYEERPSCLKKIHVRDRTVISTEDADRRVIKPRGLQEEIDACVSAIGGGRAFARPSGTENVVRVFAEAQSADDASRLVDQVCNVVQKYLC